MTYFVTPLWYGLVAVFQWGKAINIDCLVEVGKKHGIEENLRGCGAGLRGERMESYFRYWGKAEKDGERYHLLPYHCLDVADVRERKVVMH